MKSIIRTLLNAMYVLSPIVILFSISAMALRGNQDTEAQEQSAPQEAGSKREADREPRKNDNLLYTALTPGMHYLDM